MGQDARLQERVPARLGQATPPWSGCRATPRVRVCWPPPHETLQVAQSAHSDTTQSMGQLWTLHFRDSFGTGQALPPYAGDTVVVRPRCWLPLPHVSVQVDQLSQADTAQSTGQACVLQLENWLVNGHFLPPYAAATATVR